jgi:hypothetical protein
MNMVRKLPLSDFRAVRRQLEPHDFALSEGPDPPPTHLIDEETDADLESGSRSLRTSLALGAAGALARPYVANAAATTATVWWTQGYAQEEDISFKAIVAEYEGHWQ